MHDRFKSYSNVYDKKCGLICIIFYSHLQRSKVKSINYKKIPNGKVKKEDTGLRICDFFSEMVENRCAENSWFLGLRDLLLMDLCQDQQQHPSVHTEGFSRCGSVAVAVGFSDM